MAAAIGPLTSGAISDLPYSLQEWLRDVQKYLGSGFIASNNISGTTNGSSAGNGLLGEYRFFDSGSTPVTVNTANVTNIASISLAAGDWDVSACVTMHMTGVTADSFQFAFSNTNNGLTIPDPSGNNDVFALYSFYQPLSAVTTNSWAVWVPHCRYLTASTTTLYINTQITNGGGAPTGTLSTLAQIKARRMR